MGEDERVGCEGREVALDLRSKLLRRNQKEVMKGLFEWEGGEEGNTSPNLKGLCIREILSVPNFLLK